VLQLFDLVKLCRPGFQPSSVNPNTAFPYNTCEYTCISKQSNPRVYKPKDLNVRPRLWAVWIAFAFLITHLTNHQRVLINYGSVLNNTL
jgi:hypothetical protein